MMGSLGTRLILISSIMARRLCFRVSPKVAAILLRECIQHGPRSMHASVFDFQPARSLLGGAGDPPTSKLNRAFQLLEVGQDSSAEQIKEAYIGLVKKYHPDSRSPHADAKMFSEIRDAYKRCISYAKNAAMSQEIYSALEEELCEIEKNLGFVRAHNRHFLIHDVGPGTQSERQRAYAQLRLNQAMDNVFEKQFQKTLENQYDKEVGPYTGRWSGRSERITQTLERIAEDAIRESVARGEFKNLQGVGKPLERETENAVLDDMQTKLNKVLINSGFVPEWITLDKTIRISIQDLKVQIVSVWHNCGPYPMNKFAMREWEHHMCAFQTSVADINSKINLLNLIVPALSRQRVPIRLNSLVARITSEVIPAPDTSSCAVSQQAETANNQNESLWNSDSKIVSAMKNLYHSLLKGYHEKFSS